jgi:hypothetical protein
MKKKILEWLKGNKTTFVLLSVLLSFLSVHAGFHYYTSLFGLTVALSASATFEALRLSSLFGIFRSVNYTRAVAIFLYLFSAFVCVFASLSTFHARIIESRNKELAKVNEFYSEDIRAIREAQANARAKELEENSAAIKICKTKLAANYKTDYYSARLEQRIQNEKNIIAKYDSLLSYTPAKNTQAWLASEAAKYNIQLKNNGRIEEQSRSVIESIENLWNLQEEKAKRATAIIIVIAIELGIFLLALLSENVEFLDPDEREMSRLYRKHGERAISDFIYVHQSYLNEHNRLPKVRELSKKQRAIRKAIVGNRKAEQAILSTIYSLNGNGEKQA